MAPEVLKNESDAQAADMWSLGCLVFEMLTGTPPWTEFGTDPKTVMRSIKKVTEPPTLPEGLSKDCQDFLNYCFTIESLYRPSAEEMKNHPFVLIKDKTEYETSLATSRQFVAQSLQSLNRLASINFRGGGPQGNPLSSIVFPGGASIKQINPAQDNGLVSSQHMAPTKALYN